MQTLAVLIVITYTIRHVSWSFRRRHIIMLFLNTLATDSARKNAWQWL